jgi:hypothetical protein
MWQLWTRFFNKLTNNMVTNNKAVDPLLVDEEDC